MAIGTLSVVVVGAMVIGQAPPAGTQLDPGVTLRVYRVEPDLAAIPKLVADQTPNLDELRGVIDFRDDAGFGKVEGPFVSVVTGWVISGAAGGYEFKVTSDNGSRAPSCPTMMTPPPYTSSL